MDSEALQQWLARKARTEAAADSLSGILYFIGGVIASTLVALGVAWLGYVIVEQVVALTESSPSWPVKVGFPLEKLWWITLVMLVLMFAGSAMSKSSDPTAMSRAFMDFFYAGPRFVSEGLDSLRKASLWRRLDMPVCIETLSVLLTKAERRPMEYLESAVDGFDREKTVEQLRLIDGVVVLKSEPEGLTLTADLRAELGGGQAQPGKERPGSQRVMFTCGVCGCKLRIRLFLVGQVHRCPICQTRYRSFMNSLGQVSLGQELESEAPLPTFGVDNHAVLGVSSDASELEIKRAYRRLMKENHPDLCPQDNVERRQRAEEKTKAINQAYEALFAQRGR
jgi:hypothetical protein